MDKRNLTLLTDLYQLTMMNGYLKEDMQDQVVIFDVFFRQNELITYSLSAGLEQAIDYVLNLNFTKEDIDYLRGLNLFNETFLTKLATLKFTGDIYAVKEGTMVFPGEPILTVKAPIFQAQLIETAILNIINHQTLIASKAAKICYVANGDNVMEFGLRRAQGPDAGIYGSRASIIGGCNSTSNVLAGKAFDIPVAGTHAHSWVMSFDTELDAFMAYANTYPNATLLLVDTYDTLKSGIPNAIKVFDYLKKQGKKPLGIRIDSGDLAYLTKKARKMLDDAGYPDTVICASGDLDEKLVQSLKLQGAKINSWGIGTKLITSADMPALGGVYKMAGVVKEDGTIIPKIKVSETSAKITNPGFKKVVRIYDNETKKAEADLIMLFDEVIDTSKPLTITHPIETWKKITFTNYTVKELTYKIVDRGALCVKMPSLKEISTYAKQEMESFWDEYLRIDKPHIYKVDLSDKLLALKTGMLEEIRKGNK
ncbi:MAG: nicotinate phosphoribosyltransferase [Clostridia bacterium]|nr:nicotinate phosphoribosyltransferase [Clostridia bacterium]